MAPIDPNQLLQAFAPLLTPYGGIKNATEVPRLSSLMKKFSRKLVSRCVYCNVLLATDPDVLEEFLKSGGWETIHLWIKSAKELGNKPFLDELLKLLLKLPMNVDRLRENDSPKIIRKIAKQSEDPILAMKAQEVVDKWTKMIELASGVKDKKRKSNELTNSLAKESGSETKKSKQSPKPANNSSIDLNSNDSNSQPMASESEGILNSVKSAERIARPSTAKVKPGKSRLGDLVGGVKVVKSRKESGDKKSTKTSNKSLNSNTNNNDLLQNAVNNASNKPKSMTGIKIIEPLAITPVPQPVVAAPAPPPPPAKPHILHDSTSFMDALIAPPTVATKKKRRGSASGGKEMPTTASIIDSTTGPAASTSSPKASPPKTFSFYKDIIDEKVDQMATNSNSNTTTDDSMDDQSDVFEGNEEEMNHDINVDITVPDIKMDPTLILKTPVISNTASNNYYNNNKIKSILSYVKKPHKKSVRWTDENGKNSIQTVKFFELDETERVNVNRPAGSGGFSDLKRFDMIHEAQLLSQLRRSHNTFDLSEDYQSRTDSFGTWRLIPCDGDTNLIELGKDSKERLIQADRQSTSLQTFYTRNQIPDAPQEADPEGFQETELPKAIPLEDDSNPNNIHDYSNIDLPQPKTGEQLPPRLPSMPIQPPMNSFGPSFIGVGPPPMGAGPGPNFMPGGGQPMMQPFGGPPLLAPPGEQPFGVRMPGPQQQFFAPNNGPPFQQWAPPDGGPGPGGPSPPHFNSGGFQERGMGGPRAPRLPRNAQNTICKHFARNGRCRFQPKCHFLHTNER